MRCKMLLADSQNRLKSSWQENYQIFTLEKQDPVIFLAHLHNS